MFWICFGIIVGLVAMAGIMQFVADELEYDYEEPEYMYIVTKL